ncbi:pyrroloquinoline quinone-dependent dehydrogenase [Paracoccus gahaiensis]|uniref:Pyrroloquinoline quinone-dependent dehydrogenase n=1 Tax=Paracoccus gahaiensis TaxID=1706839 RepID=A0A4U0RB37_9RHOB|nr:pyrroloquinoline quinone-dependent dehydrogenase [Paracoccus gahaiensis]TJZ92473.1 pyrroloquinoline quinone-dependent dehydrogenase [Paracoccus gahaiensis]
MTLFRILPALVLCAPAASAQQTEWTGFHGNGMAQKYSASTQITPENVGDLEKAWEIHTGDVSDGSGDMVGTVWSATPILANDLLYIGTPFYRILAVRPDTGEIVWTYEPEDTALEPLTQPELKNRGVTYWEGEGDGPCVRRVYIGTMDAELHAVDADTGALCADFGEAGILNVNQWNKPDANFPLSQLQPPTVFRDKLLLGWAGKDWHDVENPLGSVFAVDARTGELEWTFLSIPEDYDGVTGTSNVWTAMSVDEENGLAYLPVSSPSADYYGGTRLEEIPLATSVTAVDGDTGEVVWSRQLVKHDIWDYDTVSAPTLIDIPNEDGPIPALVQPTKMGYAFVLNRLTGEPVFPIEDRPVPASDVEGEVASPTQPVPTLPAPSMDDDWGGVFGLADLASFGYCSRTFDELRYEGRFTPPSLEGTLAYPATAGGYQWGGGAVDPESGILYINSSRIAQIYQLIEREEYETLQTGGSEAEGGLFPMTGAPYGFRLTNFLNPVGMPCWKPPYGLMSAIDLKTGETLWERPFGQIQKWGFYMPESWGSPTIGGPVVTASGVIFIGASMDARVRALDATTGDVLWKAQVEAPAVSNPAVYDYDGRQYVVFAVGGNSIIKPQVADQLVAYALPD